MLRKVIFFIFDFTIYGKYKKKSRIIKIIKKFIYFYITSYLCRIIK